MKKLIVLLIMLLMIGKTLLSQDIQDDNWGVINETNLTIIEDIQMFNDDIIYKVTLENTTHILKKSTDRGNSWITLGSISAVTGVQSTTKGASICLIDQNTGILSCNYQIYKFNSSGLNLNPKATFDYNGAYYRNEINKVIHTNQMSMLYAMYTCEKPIISNPYTTKSIGKIYKSSDNGESWFTVYTLDAPTSNMTNTYLEDIDYDKTNENKLIVCGYQRNKTYGNTNQFLSAIIIYTENGFGNANTVSIMEGTFSNA